MFGVASDVLVYIHSKGATTSHSPTDRSHMNSVTESWVRSLKDKCDLTPATL